MTLLPPAFLVRGRMLDAVRLWLAAVTLLIGGVDVSAQEEPITDGDRDHWSFRSGSVPAIPRLDTGHGETPVDAFITARLQDAGLGSLPIADRHTLIRRMTFDLTGLPPRPEEIEAFVSESRPDAAARLADRLLASPAHGERAGQFWLDVSRFAETDGFEHDKQRPNAWRYRDWVIEAFNADPGYDEFVRMQLAGDLVAANDPDAAIATGFLLCGPDMPDINLQTERRHNVLNEMTSTVGSVFLGLQFGCAQCHDHKYDPISIHDFYRLRAFFENVDIFRDHPIPDEATREAQRLVQEQRAEEWTRLEGLIKQLDRKVLERERQRAGDSLLELPSATLMARFEPAEKVRRKELEELIKKLRARPEPKFPLGRVVREGRLRQAHVWTRGDFRRAGDEVGPAFPRVLTAGEATAESLDRRDLADWIVSDQNPIAARVFVNRLWQQHFSRGLSGAESDFGIMGEEPSHPELLGWLSAELVRHNWRIKPLRRLLIRSAVWQRATTAEASTELHGTLAALRDADPENRLLGRRTPRRLSGEMIRDAMLACTAQLNRKPGGPGVRPPLPREVVSTVLRNHWPVSPNDGDHYRRSVYLFVRRNLRYPMFDVFDRPDSNASCARRNVSTTAPQALVMLNSEFSAAAADALAHRVGGLERETTEQVRACFLLTLGREPGDEELQASLAFLEDSQSDRPLSPLCLALFNLNEFVWVD